MSSAASVPEPQAPPLSEAERVIDTFIAPSKTFFDLRRSARWLVPFLLITIAFEALTVMADKKLGFEKITENNLALRPKQAARLDQLPPDARGKQMVTVVSVTRIASYGSPLIILVVLLIVAAVLLGTFNFGLGAQLTFNQCVAVCMYTSLPLVIKYLLAMLALGVGSGDGFTFENPVASNLSGLIDPTSRFLYSLATQVDLFGIWIMALAGLAFACLTKVKRGTCMAVVFGWWVVWIVAISGVAALG